MSIAASPGRQAGRSSPAPQASPAANPVDIRLGRKIIRQPAAKAQRKRVLQVANQLAQETDWRGDLARSVIDVIEEE